jgi:hypothetical protein
MRGDRAYFLVGEPNSQVSTENTSGNCCYPPAAHPSALQVGPHVDSRSEWENLETPGRQHLIELVYVQGALKSVGRTIVAMILVEDSTDGPAGQPATDQASNRSSILDAGCSNAECFSRGET